jgi:hypothetical protein
MNNLFPPTVLKSEFWAGPKDGDRLAVPDRNKPLGYKARDFADVHVYGFSAERTRFEYVGLMSRAAWNAPVFDLQIGVER